MSKKSLNQAVLSYDDITLATGEKDHTRITEIEIIFSNIQEIDNLDACKNLYNFTMISGKLNKICNLDAVSQTLTRLCICDQLITKMEGLCLPNLRELLLHQNQISKIEGLHGCPRLQKLWLFSNKITKIENLHHCGDLREIWIQDNKISKLCGFESLSNLQSIAISNNSLSNFQDLQSLNHLPSLIDLSLHDDHFGSNPIVHAEGYRTYVACHLKQIRRLDGVEINSRDKSSAKDAYLSHVLRFNDRIDAIQREHEREIHAIESRRNRNNSHGDTLRNELLNAFKELEKVVKEGRGEILAEHKRQLEIRDSNFEVLEAELYEIRKRHLIDINQQIAIEEKLQKEEESIFSEIENRLKAERDQALLIAGVYSNSNGGISFQHLAEHSPDWRFVASYFLQKEVETKKQSKKKELKVLQVYRIFNQQLNQLFSSVTTINNSMDINSSSENDSTLRLFHVCQRSRMKQIMITGINDIKKPMVFFTDPSLAVSCYENDESFISDPKETVNSSISDEAEISDTFELLLCRLWSGSLSVVLCESIPSWDEIEKHMNSLSKTSPFIQLKYVDKNRIRGSVYLINPKSNTIILPQYHISCGNACLEHREDDIDSLIREMCQPSSSSDSSSSSTRNLTKNKTQKNNNTSLENRREPKDLFDQFISEAGSKLFDYQQRICSELDPETAKKRNQMDEESQRLIKTIEVLRSHINNEKSTQEQLLRNYRQHLVPNRSRREK